MLDYYTLRTLFAVLRLLLWFLIIFIWVAPILFEDLDELNGIERLIFSWLGLGGVIIISVAALTILNIYDFFSIALTIILIPVVRALWLNRKGGVFVYLERFETRTIISHIRLIEGFKSIKNLFKHEIKGERIYSKKNLLSVRFWGVFIVISTSFLLRIIPALQHAEPFSREWFFNLHHMKAIRLQNYFDGSPSPAGLFSFLSLFSMLTQISPELILHIFGAVSNVLLLLIIYWALKKMLNTEQLWGPLFGTAVLGMVPAWFLPIDLNHQTEANALMFSLCFAIPTIILFITERKQDLKSKMFFISMGIIATGLTNLFVLLMIVLPVMLVTFIAQLYLFDAKKNVRDLIRIVISLVILSIPYSIFLVNKNMNLLNFIQEQLFSTSIYSNLSHLILPINELSQIYILIAAILLIIYGLFVVISKRIEYLNIILFSFFFILISLLYVPYFHLGYTYIDLDQFNGFYTILISALFGVLFYSICLILNRIFKRKTKISLYLSGILFVAVISGIIYKKGIINFYQPDSQTFPGSFYRAYYKIINDNVPYTYSMVGPDIDSTMAINRHGFMDYNYFLTDYNARDSVYYNKYYPNLKDRDKHNDLSNVFVFLEKKPYNEIQIGILPDQKQIMENMSKWISNYKKKKYRTERLYFSSHDVKVYELVNNPKTSNVYSVLFHNTEGN